MELVRTKINWNKLLIGAPNHIMIRFLILWIILSAVITSCESDPYGENWDKNISTICEYLKTNQEEYSKFCRLLDEGKLFTALCAYNPYGEDYTLFLPTDEAIDHFIEQNQNYENFEELMMDTSFIYTLVRYHTLNKKVRTNDFPDGAIIDRTLTGDRLSVAFYTKDNNALIKINNVAPIIKPNLEMTNGYIHVISEVLQPVEVSGYEWLQQQDDYSILAKAMELSGIKYKLWMDKYTILAEHDSVYHRNGILNIEDLIGRVRTSLILYNFAAFHIIGGEYYLNDLNWGNNKYWTIGNEQLVIDVGDNIRIDPGSDNYGITISEKGDTTGINYIRPVWESCNIVTKTGPVHSISDLLISDHVP